MKVCSYLTSDRCFLTNCLGEGYTCSIRGFTHGCDAYGPSRQVPNAQPKFGLLTSNTPQATVRTPLP